MNKMTRETISRLTLCAMMIALSAVLRRFTVPFYLGGALTMKVNFDGAFLAFAAVVGGPVYGAIAYGAADILGYLVNPQGGAYIPLLTVVAAAKGGLVGLLWRGLRGVGIRGLGLGAAGAFAGVAALGAVNALLAAYAGGGAYGRWLASFGSTGGYFSVGLMIAGGLGLASCCAAYALRGHLPRLGDGYFRAMFALMLPGLTGTAANTWVLKAYALLPDKAFSAILVPRLSKEALLTVLNAYLLVVIIAAYQKAVSRVSP